MSVFDQGMVEIELSSEEKTTAIKARPERRVAIDPDSNESHSSMYESSDEGDRAAQPLDEENDEKPLEISLEDVPQSWKVFPSLPRPPPLPFDPPHINIINLLRQVRSCGFVRSGWGSLKRWYWESPKMAAAVYSILVFLLIIPSALTIFFLVGCVVTGMLFISRQLRCTIMSVQFFSRDGLHACTDESILLGGGLHGARFSGFPPRLLPHFLRR